MQVGGRAVGRQAGRYARWGTQVAAGRWQVCLPVCLSVCLFFLGSGAQPSLHCPSTVQRKSCCASGSAGMSHAMPFCLRDGGRLLQHEVRRRQVTKSHKMLVKVIAVMWGGVGWGRGEVRRARPRRQ